MPAASTSQFTDFRRFFVRAGLFLAPLVFVLALDNVLLPRGTFTFRTWEALAVSSYAEKLPGPFYPNQKIRRNEVGDLGNGTPWAVKKDVAWETDRLGYRNAPGSENGADIVIVGDSMAVGTSLDQDEILSRQLARATGRSVYAFAPTDILGSMRVVDEKYADAPKVLVFERVERFVPTVAAARPNFSKGRKLKSNKSGASEHIAFFVQLDYLRKMALIRSARGWLDRRTNAFVAAIFGAKTGMDRSRSVDLAQGRMVTLEGSHANDPKTAAQIAEYAQNIASYARGLRARGIEMVFLAVPNKEAVYWDKFEPAIRPTFLPALVKRVNELGVTAPDLQAAMLRARAEHPEVLLYQLDDTHWNAEGARIAVEELTKVLPKSVGPPTP